MQRMQLGLTGEQIESMFFQMVPAAASVVQYSQIVEMLLTQPAE